MTVAELIARLSKYPLDAQVLFKLPGVEPPACWVAIRDDEPVNGDGEVALVNERRERE